MNIRIYITNPPSNAVYWGGILAEKMNGFYHDHTFKLFSLDEAFEVTIENSTVHWMGQIYDNSGNMIAHQYIYPDFTIEAGNYAYDWSNNELVPVSGNSRIVGFRVEPSKASYSPGENVQFSGKLEWNDWPFGWRDAPGAEIHLLGNGSVLDTTETSSTGTFLFNIRLPFTAGTYMYRAYYPGSVFWQEDYTLPITVTIEGNGPEEFYCPYCNELFYTQEELDQHIADEHTFPCPHCDLVFSTQATLDEHIELVHPNGNGVPWDKVLLYGSIGAAVLMAVALIASKGGRK